MNVLGEVGRSATLSPMDGSLCLACDVRRILLVLLLLHRMLDILGGFA